MFHLTDDELSALIEACNVANNHNPRPPWDRAGQAAWNKLVQEEYRRAELAKPATYDPNKPLVRHISVTEAKARMAASPAADEPGQVGAKKARPDPG